MGSHPKYITIDPARCCEVVQHRDGVHNLRGGNGRGIGRFRYEQCARPPAPGSDRCWQHRKEEARNGQ